MSTLVSPQPHEAEESEQEEDVWDDDGNLIALFVLDEIPVTVSSTLVLHYTKY